ncbi:MAG: hypothetical protein GZ091_18495, partial [Paludibacter sp.]|nr:hypothetical protein [Paludibacter sp.]
YQKNNYKRELGIGYYYKARLYKRAQRFDEATQLYLKALDIFKKSEEYYFLGEINSELGDICAIQTNFNVSLQKYQLSRKCFLLGNDTIDACNKLVDIGRMYGFLHDTIKSLQYYKKAISQTTDSFVHGAAYQEIGINYYKTKKFDSAVIILKKSLKYPYRGTSYAIRCYVLADVYYDSNQFDSAIYYSKLSFKYPTTFYLQRDCYRILANTEYNRENFKKAEVYIGKYQDYSDSVRILAVQTKSTVLEDLHTAEDTTNDTKRNMVFATTFSMIIIFLLGCTAFYFYKRNRSKKEKLTEFKEQLIGKQAFLSQNLSTKIEEVRQSQADERKNASSEERIRLDKELYEKCLHLSNWDAFTCEMNHAFNNIVEVLQNDFPAITQKEITWCCLHLLDIPNSDRILVLNTTSEGLYKLKQRLAKKFNLSSTRELDLFLQELGTLKN